MKPGWPGVSVRGSGDRPAISALSARKLAGTLGSPQLCYSVVVEELRRGRSRLAARRGPRLHRRAGHRAAHDTARDPAEQATGVHVADPDIAALDAGDVRIGVVAVRHVVAVGGVADVVLREVLVAEFSRLVLEAFTSPLMSPPACTLV